MAPSIPAFLPLRASQPSSYSAKSPSEPSVWICVASAAAGSCRCQLRTAEVRSVFEAYLRRSGNFTVQVTTFCGLKDILAGFEG